MKLIFDILGEILVGSLKVRGVMLLALKDMDRTYTNVLYIDLATK